MVFHKVEARHFVNIDWGLVISTILICTIGLMVLYSAGYQKDLGVSPQMERQLITMGVGFGVFFVCMLIKTNFWYRAAYGIYIFCLAVLVLVLFQGVEAGGAARWLDFGGVRVQPSEFSKLAMILVLARSFANDAAPREGYTLTNLIWPLALIFIPLELIRQQPDLGTGLCHLLIGGSMLLVAGVERKTFIRLAITGVALLVPLWSALKDYQRKRILSFLSPESDPLGSGYHAIQSKIAVGSGMFSGKGYLQGTQTQLRFLPEQTTDFIFSVLAEEWGLVGTVTILALYAFLIYRLVRIAQRCTDPFPAFVSVGMAAFFFWHMSVNIGMVTGLLPVKGLTLPLVSFGGSSIVTLLAGLGIVTGFSMRRFAFR